MYICICMYKQIHVCIYIGDIIWLPSCKLSSLICIDMTVFEYSNKHVCINIHVRMYVIHMQNNYGSFITWGFQLD